MVKIHRTRRKTHSASYARFIFECLNPLPAIGNSSFNISITTQLSTLRSLRRSSYRSIRRNAIFPAHPPNHYMDWDIFGSGRRTRTGLFGYEPNVILFTSPLRKFYAQILTCWRSFVSQLFQFIVGCRFHLRE